MRLRVKLMLIHGGVVLGGALIALVVLELVAGHALRRSAERHLQQSAALATVCGAVGEAGGNVYFCRTASAGVAGFHATGCADCAR